MAKHRMTLLKPRGISLRSANAGPKLVARIKAGAAIEIQGRRLVLSQKRTIGMRGLAIALLLVPLTLAVVGVQANSETPSVAATKAPCVDGVSIGMVLPKAKLVAANVINLGGVSQVRLKDACTNQNLLLTVNTKTEVIIGLKKT